MLVNFTTDKNIRGSIGLKDHVTGLLTDALERYGERITRVEVSLTDENSDKKTGDNDMRCFFEARLAGMQPITVSCQAATMDAAIDGAVDKLLHAIEHRVGKQDHKKGGVPMNGSGDGLDGTPGED
jgi:ribosome-associated translation inhibitor RaiA